MTTVREDEFIADVSLTTDEFGHSVLIRVFALVGPLLGRLVQSVLKKVYREEAEWCRKAGDGLSRDMYSRLKKTQEQSLKDVYLISELILENLEVFSQCFVRVGEDEIDRLSKLALEVDRVSRTRICLFHGAQVSIEDVYGCVLSLEEIWRGFPQLDASRSSVVCELSHYREVRPKLPSG